MINFADELEKQQKIDSVQGEQQAVKEYKLAEGIYFQDFRQKQASASKSCFEIFENQKKNYVPPRSVVILEADFKEFQKRIEKLKESIEEILQIDDWKDDKDFRDAVEENYEAIHNNYKKQLDILITFQELDPCCDILKKNTRSEIEQQIGENKILQTNFLKEMYGLKDNRNSSNNNDDNNIEIEEQSQNQVIKKDNDKIKDQKDTNDDNQEDMEDEDDLMSIQDQLNKQKLETDNNDEGVYL